MLVILLVLIFLYYLLFYSIRIIFYWMFLIFKYIKIEFDSPHEKRFCDDPYFEYQNSPVRQKVYLYTIIGL